MTWNSARELPGLLRSAAQHVPDYELVFVDNASADSSVAIARAHRGNPVTVLRQDCNHGFGGASNIGVRVAAGSTVVLLNPDTILPDASIRSVVARAAREPCLVGPRLLNADGSIQPSASCRPGGIDSWLRALVPSAFLTPGLTVRCSPWRADSVRTVSWLTGACLVAQRGVLAGLGPFDPRIHLYAEDMDLGLRAAHRGIHVVFDPEGRVVHLGDRSSSQRFSDRGLTLAVRNRRRVVRRACGALVSTSDFATENAYHSSRVLAKLALGRDAADERAWFRAAYGRAEVIRHDA